MQYIVDAVIAVIIVVSIARGMRKGLVKTVFGLFSVIAAFVVAYLFGSTAGEFIRTTHAYESVCNSTKQSLTEYFEEKAHDGADDLLSGLDDLTFVKQLDALGIDTQKELDKYKDALDGSAKDASEAMSENIAMPVLEALSNIVGTAAVFVVSLAVLWIASALLSTVFKLPVLRSVNKAGGLVFGVIAGFIYAFVLCAVIKSVIPCVPENPVIYRGMENDTVLYGFFSELNPLYLWLFGRFLG